MKFILVLAAVLGLAYGQSSCSAPTPNLQTEFEKFAALIPVKQIEQIAINYITNDAQVQQVLQYLQGKDFAKVVQIVNSQKEVIDLYAFLCKNGVPIYKAINSMNDILGLSHVTPAPTKDVHPSTRTFRQFMDDIEKEIPLEKLQDLFQEEKKSSPVFKELVDRISSAQFRAMVDRIKALPEVVAFRTQLVKLGADMDWLEDFVRKLLGWENN